MGTENSRKRRRYGAELKAQILAECEVPGASVAKVAMSRGINANIVHGWRKLVRDLGEERRRVALMAAAIAVSLMAVGTVLGAYAILTREMAVSYLGTRPASATLAVALPTGVRHVTERRYAGIFLRGTSARITGSTRPSARGHIRSATASSLSV